LLTSSASLNIERLVQMIVNEAYHQIQNRYLIILDDYHLTGDNETIKPFCQLLCSAGRRELLSLSGVPRCSGTARSAADISIAGHDGVAPALHNLAARHEHVHRVGQLRTMSILPRRCHSRSRHKLLAFLDSVPETQLLDLKNRVGI